MLGFSALGKVPVAGGTGRRGSRFVRVTGSGSRSSTYSPFKRIYAAAAGAGASDSASSTARAGGGAALGVAGQTNVLASIRLGSVAVGAAGSVMVAGVPIKLSALVVVLGGLCGTATLPIYLGRPGMQTDWDRPPPSRARPGAASVVPGTRDAQAGRSSSRPAVASVVPASRETSVSVNRATSRKASGGAASTQRSASNPGPALRRADSSIDTGKER